MKKNFVRVQTEDSGAGFPFAALGSFVAYSLAQECHQ